MRVQMKTDINGRALQSLQPYGTPVNVTISGSSAGSTIPTNAQVIRVAATGNCYIKFGVGTQTATTNDMLFPSGTEFFTLDLSWTHFAVIQEGSATGTVSITEMI